MIYLDNNATTRPTPRVCAAVAGALERYWQNPSSTHRAGQSVRQQIELARVSTAALVGAKPAEITFTSGGTESIDLCLRGTMDNTRGERRVLVTTKIEHAAVRELAEFFEKEGLCKVVWLPLRAGGVVDLDAAAGLIDDSTRLVSVQWANNETGAIQPVHEIAELCRARGAKFHCDATQWVGREPAFPPTHAGVQPGSSGSVGGRSLPADAGFDFLTFAPHKYHGPKGVGVLWARAGVPLRPQLLGTQEQGRRGGTENVPGIIGAGVAAIEAIEWLSDPEERERGRELRDRFERELLAAIPSAVVNGRSAGGADGRVWNTSNIGFPGLESEALLIAMSEMEDGVCASAGAACSSGSLEPSPVLLAMGIAERIAHGSLRFSLSRETSHDEIDRAVLRVIQAVKRVSTSGGI